MDNVTRTCEQLEPRRMFAVLFADEFNGNAIGSAWNYQTPLWNVRTPGGEVERFDGANVTVANGSLNLTAKKDAGGNWTSGEAHTSGGWTYGNSAPPGYSFKYGYIESRMKAPATISKSAGLWLALWMMPTPNGPGNLHDNGEIDLIESVPDGAINDLDSVHLHLSGNNAGKDYHTGVDLSAGFFTVGLDWQPNSLTWYFNNTVVLTVTGNVPSDEHYLILNLAVGDSGSWPGAANAQTANPATFSVDYLHVTSTRAERFGGTPANPIPGDCNHDFKVDISDLAILNANFGKKTATWEQGDFSGDGAVDIGDLGILATNYGFNTGGTVTQADFATDLATLTKAKHHRRWAA